MSSIYMGFNPAANQAAREMQANNSSLNKALTSLTTGNRINTAGDDAAGYTIGKNMEVKITGMKRAVRNANDAISAFQVLGGSLKGLTDRVARLQELATQANSSFNGAGDIANIQKEVSSLIAGIDSDAKQANFNGVNLMEKEREFSVQVGDSASDQIKLNVESMTVKSLGMDKIDFSVFSSETRYLKEGSVAGKIIAQGKDTEVADVINDNTKSTGGSTVTFSNFSGSNNLAFAKDKKLSEITATFTNSESMVALQDKDGKALTDKIAIQNATKTQFIILDLDTNVDATGVVKVNFGLNSATSATSATAMTKTSFENLYRASVDITDAAELNNVIKADVQKKLSSRNISAANITLEGPTAAAGITGTNLAAATGVELKQVLDSNGEAKKDEFYLSVTNAATKKVKLFAVKITELKSMSTGSHRSMKLTVGDEYQQELKQYDASNSKDTLLGKLKEAYDKINEVSSTVGATITGLNNTIESLSTNISNTADAHARIIKADIIETYSEASSRKVQQQAIAQAMQMANSLTEIALQAMR
ncbi:flagellin [Moellerella wisconsensis]|uniref:flagellin N-terminal helical domain-containing protein n=1 Tax=Moellerella wisconsensis TaxID=158849 RepID=UPI00307628E4